MPLPTEHLDQLVLPYTRKDFPELRADFTVQQALDSIRQQGLGEKVIYFYVVDNESRLVGVLPTRRLLISPLDRRLGEIMIPRVIALPHTATILEACELFVLHKFLAFPVIDAGCVMLRYELQLTGTRDTRLPLSSRVIPCARGSRVSTPSTRKA